VLLLDEPTSNLDLEHALQLVVLLKKLAAAGRGVLIASHDLNLLAPHTAIVSCCCTRGGCLRMRAPEQALSRGQHGHRVRRAVATAPSGYFPRDFSL
jgi:ABC-type hemin transport system ATPase subunit